MMILFKKYILPVFLLALFSCTKDQASETDAELYEKAKDTAGFTWYKHSDTLLPRSSGSGHGQPYLRTRYNALAAAQLDSSGKIKSNAVFATGSLIVKELYLDGQVLDRYAILYKDPEHGNADPKGWVWGYINADGSVAVSASKKGNSCINCHSQNGNID